MNKLPDEEETNIGVHVFLFTSDNQIILQQRDDNPNIVNPGLISMFGGTIKKEDDLVSGLKRELQEELEMNLDNYTCEHFGTYYKTKALDGVDWTVHIFLVKNVKREDLKLHEGKGFVIKWLSELLDEENLTRITKLALKDYAKKVNKNITVK